MITFDRGVVVWITGLPASGKSSLAAALVEELQRRGVHPVRLDGDEVRAALVPPHGHDPVGRDAFYASLAMLAGMLAWQGLVVVVAATAHRRAFRERARRLAPTFHEVLVDAPLDECRRRDPRGLYARHAAGEAPSLPGTGEPYERPEAPDVVASGGEDRAAVEAIVARVLPLGTGVPYSHILCPVDFSLPSRAAAEHAADLARATHATLTLVHAFESPVRPMPTGGAFPPSPETLRTSFARVDELLAAERDAALRRGAPEVRTAIDDAPAAARIITRASDGKHDLIVVGTHGRGGLSRLLLGSVAEAVVRGAPCPVLVVRAPDR